MSTVGLDIQPSKMKVNELRDELEKRGLPTDGLKAELIARLEEALAAGPSAASASTESAGSGDISASTEVSAAPVPASADSAIASPTKGAASAPSATTTISSPKATSAPAPAPAPAPVSDALPTEEEMNAVKEKAAKLGVSQLTSEERTILRIAKFGKITAPSSVKPQANSSEKKEDRKRERENAPASAPAPAPMDPEFEAKKAARAARFGIPAAASS